MKTVNLERNEIVAPEHVSAIILNLLRESSKKRYGEYVNCAVIAVPANFNDVQKQATIDAGKIAGFDVLGTISEPNAAAICYAHNIPQGLQLKRNVLVFDFGGGTLDVSIISINERKFTVLGTNGDPHCGGDDIDQIIIQDMIEFLENKNIEITEELRGNLRDSAIALKEQISTIPKVTVQLKVENQYIGYSLTRSSFTQKIKSILQKIEKIINDSLKLSEIDKSEIHDVIMVGGSSKLLPLKEFIKDIFNKTPISPVDEFEAISIGASIYGATLLKTPRLPEIEVHDVVPLSYGIRTIDGVQTMVRKGTPRPTVSQPVRYIGRAWGDRMRVVLCEGDEDSGGWVNVSETVIEPPAYDSSEQPVVDLVVDVREDSVAVKASLGADSLPLATRTRAEAALSDAEVERFRSDIERFLAPPESTAEETLYAEIGRLRTEFFRRSKRRGPDAAACRAVVEAVQSARERLRAAPSDTEEVKAGIRAAIEGSGLQLPGIVPWC